MGIFSEPKKTAYKKYDAIMFSSSVNNIVENDPIKLIKLMQEEVDAAEKIKLAEKLTKCIGVPGLLYYLDASYILLKEEKERGLSIQQAGLNDLSYLMLAKTIYDNDPEAKKIMEQFMPEEQVDVMDYWDSKKDKIIRLADLVGFEKEAEIIGKQLFTTFFPGENKDSGHAKRANTPF